MARFRGTMQGGRGEVSRLGHATSGLWARVDGWHDGVYVEALDEEGHDVFHVYATGGSSGSHSRRIGSVTLGGRWVPNEAAEDEPIPVEADEDKDDNGVPLDAICTNCGHRNGEHQAVGDWCPDRSKGWGEYSTTSKFSQVPKDEKPSSARPPIQYSAQVIADEMRKIAAWIEEDDQDASRDEVVQMSKTLATCAWMVEQNEKPEGEK